MIKYPSMEKIYSYLPEFIKFILVGVLRSIVSISLIFILYNILHIHYIICNVAGFAVGLIIGFVLHKKWAFNSDADWGKEVLPYLAVFGVGYLVNFILLLLCVEIWGLNKNLSQVIAIAGFTTVNYLGNVLWTFRRSRQ